MSVSAADPNDPKVQLINAAARVLVEAKQVPHSAPGHWAGALYEAGLLVDPSALAHGRVVEPEPEAAPEPEGDHVISTRVDLVPVAMGKVTPLYLDLGSDNTIVVQPKEDQADGELALNIIIGGGLPVEVVAWMLGQAAEAMVHGIRANRVDLEVPRG